MAKKECRRFIFGFADYVRRPDGPLAGTKPRRAPSYRGTRVPLLENTNKIVNQNARCSGVLGNKRGDWAEIIPPLLDIVAKRLE